MTEKIRSLENRIMSLEATVGQHSEQPATNVEISPPSQRRSSVASTERPNLGADRPRDPIDDITIRTQCELLVLMGKSSKFELRVMRKSKKKAGQYIASRFLKDTPESLLTELLKNTGKTWASQFL